MTIHSGDCLSGWRMDKRARIGSRNDLSYIPTVWIVPSGLRVPYHMQTDLVCVKSTPWISILRLQRQRQTEPNRAVRVTWQAGPDFVWVPVASAAKGKTLSEPRQRQMRKLLYIRELSSWIQVISSW